MKDQLVRTLMAKLRRERIMYKRLVVAYAEELKTNESLKDTIALLMQQKGK